MLDQLGGGMPIAKMILAGASVLCIFTSAASAESLTGRVTGINRLNNTISIQQTQDGTVGATAGSIDEFRMQDGVSLENVHVEDRVTYSVNKTGGPKTITKIDRQK
jgi:Copper binding periplasmic protein CusF